MLGSWGCEGEYPNLAVWEGVGGTGTPVLQDSLPGEIWAVDADVAGGRAFVVASSWGTFTQAGTMVSTCHPCLCYFSWFVCFVNAAHHVVGCTCPNTPPPLPTHTHTTPPPRYPSPRLVGVFCRGLDGRPLTRARRRRRLVALALACLLLQATPSQVRLYAANHTRQSRNGV